MKLIKQAFKENYKSILSGILLGLFVFLLLVVFSCKSAEPKTASSDLLKGKSCILVIAPENFRDEEFVITKNTLIENGAYVEVASVRKGIIKGMLGLEVNVNKTISEFSPSDFDCVVVIGGSGAPTLLEYPEVINFVGSAYKLNKTIAGICLGPMILAKAGVLNGKEATVFETDDSLRIFNENNVTFLRKQVVVDGNIITSNNPKYAKEFADALVDLLSKN
ncbi:MAG: protease [Candidatus Woesearchaeota archaeon]|nr:protease [Candidatus Woesearchaeota archaeon]